MTDSVAAIIRNNIQYMNVIPCNHQERHSVWFLFLDSGTVQHRARICGTIRYTLWVFEIQWDCLHVIWLYYKWQLTSAWYSFVSIEPNWMKHEAHSRFVDFYSYRPKKLDTNYCLSLKETKIVLKLIPYLKMVSNETKIKKIWKISPKNYVNLIISNS